jgi:hypothetical protein
MSNQLHAAQCVSLLSSSSSHAHVDEGAKYKMKQSHNQTGLKL